jgi:hypothetical protein
VAICVLIEAAAFVVLLIWTWRRLGDPLVDFGRDAYTAWQVLEGRPLYAELAYLYGPLSPHVNALWFGLFGVSLTSLQLCNAAVLALTCILLHRLLRRAGSGQVVTAAAVVVFLALFGFGFQTRLSNYNFLTPYVHSATHGFVLCLGTASALAALAPPRPGCDARLGAMRWAVVAGACAGLAFLTKPEMFLAAIVTLGAGLPVALWARFGAPCRGWLAPCAGALSGFVLAPLAFIAALAPRIGFTTLIAGTLGGYAMALDERIAQMKFFREGLGVEHVGRNVWKTITYFCLYIQCVAPMVLIAVALRKRRAWVIWTCGIVFAIAGFALSWWAPVSEKTWRDFARGLPIAVVVALIASLVGLWRASRVHDSTIAVTAARAILALLALGLIGRMLLAARLYQYGFVQASVGFVLAVTVLLEWLPRLVRRAGGSATALRLGACGLLAGVVAIHLRDMRLLLLERDTPLRTEAGELMILRRNDPRTRPLLEFLDDLSRRAQPGDTLAAWPEASMLNFLTRLPNPTPYDVITPLGLVHSHGEAPVLASLRAHPPTWIALTDLSSESFGAASFGADYGRELDRWMRENYDEVKLFGAEPMRGRGFGILLLRRRDSPGDR